MDQKSSNSKIRGLLFAVIFTGLLFAASILTGDSSVSSYFMIALMAIFWLGMVVLLAAELKNKYGQKQNKANAKRSPYVVLLFFMAGLLLVTLAVIFDQATPIRQRFWWILIASFFILAMAVGLISEPLKKFLGRAMRARKAESSQSPAGSEFEVVESEECLTPPPKPFDYKIFDVNNTPAALTPEAESLLKRAAAHYNNSILSLKNAALLLWTFYLLLTIIGFLAGSPPPVSLSAWFLCSAALFAGTVVANPNRYRTNWTGVYWMGILIVWVGIFVFTFLDSAIQLIAGQNDSHTVIGLSLLMILSAIFLMVGWGQFRRRSSKLQSQVTNEKPLNLLVLWVFGPIHHIVSVLEKIGVQWRYIGTLQFLRGGDYTFDMSQMGTLLKGKGEQLIADSQEKLAQIFGNFQYTPDGSGVYPMNTMLCGDAVWKQAVHAMLRNSQVVVMNLAGFSEANQGCRYELNLLMDRFPTQRILFLIDKTTDLDFLLATLEKEWNTMCANSPNRNHAASPIRIYRLSIRLDDPFLLRGTPSGRSITPETLKKKKSGISVETPGAIQAYRMFSALQTASAPEADCLIRLVVQGAVSN